MDDDITQRHHTMTKTDKTKQNQTHTPKTKTYLSNANALHSGANHKQTNITRTGTTSSPRVIPARCTALLGKYPSDTGWVRLEDDTFGERPPNSVARPA